MFPVELVVTDGGDKIAAVAYRAAKPLDRELPPSRAFVETLVKGARGSQLSAAWIDRLSRLL